MLPCQIWGHNMRSATIFCTSPEERRSLKIGSFPCGGAGIKGQQFWESSWILLRKVNFRQAPMRPTTLDVEHCSLTSSCLYILLGCLQHLPLCLPLKDVEKKMQMVHEGEISTGHVKMCMIQCKRVRDNRLEPFQLCGRNFLIFFLGLQVRFGPGNMLHLSRLSDNQNRIWIEFK